MLKQSLVQNRSERVIGVARVVLAVPALVAALISPPQPVENIVYLLPMLAGYAALAVLFSLWMWRRPLTAPPLGYGIHATDLLVIAALVYLSDGSTSPFFPLYLFATLSATLRWNWRGALASSLIIVLLFIPTAVFPNGGIIQKSDELLRYIVRIGQIVAVGGLLAYMGAQRERIWEELFGIARPVDGNPGSVPEAIDLGLRHVADYFDVARVILAWERHDQPGWQAVAHDRHAARSPLPAPLPALLPTTGRPPVDSMQAGVAFAFRAGATRSQRYDLAGNLTEVDQPLLDAEQAGLWQIRDAVVAAVRGEALTGWLVIPKAAVDEDLYIAHALAVKIAGLLDQATATEKLRAAAASEERVRVAHDLHDGILQFLAGLSLQLKLMERANGSDPASVADRIAQLQTALQREQRDLRAFITAIRPRTPPASIAPDAQAAMLAQQWNIAIDASQTVLPPAELATDTQQIIREAVANAVRHGGAQRIIITAGADQDGYRLTITDDGRGFAEPGSFTDTALRASMRGPKSILDRVERLGGQLRLDSRAGETRLHIRLPLNRLAAIAKVLT